MTLERTELDRVLTSPLFAGVEEETVRAALTGPQAVRRAYQKGDILYAPHDFSRSLGILLHGTVSVHKEDLPVSQLGPGDLFGAAALFNQEADYVTTLRARTPCAVLYLTQGRVEELLDRHPQVRHNYLAYLSGRIRFLSAKVDQLAGPTAQDKLLHYLQRRAPEGPSDCSLTELAARLGMGRATLYRALDALEAEGTLRREGKTLRLMTRKDEV